ncbi:SAM-dependent methyltransferase [Streptomyces sp. NBC_01498]|uniref:SAM-dependent methyltransferase n=1 Tax=Streptomyces sp. NBC_01498 TaxID=2975870 RepID=UPI002E7AE256|nr:SAM-dependent methyltransferase [Streptomyces sp. NBC_01498]WTL25748.1 SAM-dependent methyltransferase [Streptomyces sp. NBC_01498]
MSDSVRPGTNVMPTVPNSARIWNYAQNGQDNYQVDRDLADVMMRDFPEIKTAAMESRAFQERVAEYVVRDGGVRQLLDLGTGIPTGSGTHGLAQKAAPESRVVYVDNDPVVLNHASSLRSSPEGKIHYLQQDFRNVDAVLEDAARTLNLDEPVALLVLSTLGHFPPAEAAALVGAYMSRLASGSYLAVCDTIETPGTLKMQEHYVAADPEGAYLARTPDQIAACAEGLDLVAPGLRPLPELVVPEGESVPEGAADCVQWGFLAVKP